MSETKLKPTTTEIAAEVKKAITIDPKSGVGKLPDGFYEKRLPEGITVELIQKLQEHNTQEAAGVALGFGQASEAVLKKHKDLDRTTLELTTVGKDGFDFTFDRSRQVPDRNADGTTGTKTTFGSIRVGYHTYGTKSRGELAKVKDILAESAAKTFGG